MRSFTLDMPNFSVNVDMEVATFLRDAPSKMRRAFPVDPSRLGEPDMTKTYFRDKSGQAVTVMKATVKYDVKVVWPILEG